MKAPVLVLILGMLMSLGLASAQSKVERQADFSSPQNVCVLPVRMFAGDTELGRLIRAMLVVILREKGYTVADSVDLDAHVEPLLGGYQDPALMDGPWTSLCSDALNLVFTLEFAGTEDNIIFTNDRVTARLEIFRQGQAVFAGTHTVESPIKFRDFRLKKLDWRASLIRSAADLAIEPLKDHPLFELADTLVTELVEPLPGERREQSGWTDEVKDGSESSGSMVGLTGSPDLSSLKLGLRSWFTPYVGGEIIGGSTYSFDTYFGSAKLFLGLGTAGSRYYLLGQLGGTYFDYAGNSMKTFLAGGGLGIEWLVGILKNHGIALELGYAYSRASLDIGGYEYDRQLPPYLLGGSYTYYFSKPEPKPPTESETFYASYSQKPAKQAPATKFPGTVAPTQTTAVAESPVPPEPKKPDPCAPPPAKEKRPPTVAVINLVVSGGYTSDEAEYLSGVLRKALTGKEEFEVLDGAGIVNKLREHGENPESLCDTLACHQRLAKLLDAEVVVTGYLGKIFGKTRMQLLATDIVGATELLNLDQPFNGADEALVEYMKGQGQQLAELIVEAVEHEAEVTGDESEKEAIPIACLDVQTSPPGAIIELGGKAIGTAPLIDHIFPPGEVKLAVRKTGYQPVEEKFAAKPWQHLRLNFNLKEEEQPVARLQLTTNVPEATILLDTWKVGSFAKGERIKYLDNLTTGEHTLTVETEFYQASETIDLKPKQVNAVHLDLLVKEGLRPPMGVGRVVGEMGLGLLFEFAGALAGAIIIALPLSLFLDEESESNESNYPPAKKEPSTAIKFIAYSGTLIGGSLGCAGGVYWVGTAGGSRTSSFYATWLLGGLSAIAIATTSAIITQESDDLFWVPLLLSMPITTTVAFNLSREYKQPEPLKLALLNGQSDKLSLSLPMVALLQDQTTHKVLPYVSLLDWRW